jgi:AcrR family transcriptional regulator
MRMAPTRTERRARTRDRLVDAAERLFIEQGFDSTPLEAVADAAGFTKGAVYSNFTSKEDLFFAVYERRVERFLVRVERTMAEAPNARDTLRQVVGDVPARRGQEDGWLAVFFEFWTHVLRHPEHRQRFAAAHARAVAPLVATVERLAAESGAALPLPAEPVTVAMFAMVTGLSLERLTQPEVIDADLAVRMQDLWIDALADGRLNGAGPRGA